MNVDLLETAEIGYLEEAPPPCPDGTDEDKKGEVVGDGDEGGKVSQHHIKVQVRPAEKGKLDTDVAVWLLR